MAIIEYYKSQTTISHFGIILSFNKYCSCNYCYRVREDKDYIISYEEIDTIFKYIRGFNFISLYEEPLLFPEICNYINKKRLEAKMMLNIFTTGFLEENNYSILKEIKPDLITIEYGNFHKSKKQKIEKFIESQNTIIKEDWVGAKNDTLDILKGISYVEEKQYPYLGKIYSCKYCLPRGIYYYKNNIYPICIKYKEKCLCSTNISDIEKIKKEIFSKKYYLNLYKEKNII